ncbi:multidrug effflux MFS transporter [Moraxella porci]|nr:multidrug effflux MFS transporter [Moraxella porci]MDH2273132.1 multidrug effflux MFS transporter [Moraxella porci]
MTTKNHEAHFPALWVMMLGVMVAIGPLSIDMYLPAFPSMAEDFGVSVSVIAKSVPAYFIGLVFGQLFYGPFSDRVGRVKPMYLGMTIFIIASIICATTNNEYVLFAARTLQALGACVTAVVTRAAIRDTLNPVQTARAFSLMVLVMGVAPILAPSLGAMILQVADWHAVFWFLAGFGLLNLILTKLFLKETLKPEYRNTKPMRETFGQYLSLIKDGRFMLPALAAGLLQGAFFIYLSISSELFMVNYHLTEQQFAIAFGANAFGFIALTQVNQLLTKRFDLVQLLRVGALIQLIASSCLLVLGLMFGGQADFYLVFLSIFICIAGLGFTQPNAAAIALAFQKSRAGMASAMQGALQFSVGIFGGLLIGLFELNPVTKLGIIVSILVMLGTWLVFRIDPKTDLSSMQ